MFTRIKITVINKVMGYAVTANKLVILSIILELCDFKQKPDPLTPLSPTYSVLNVTASKFHILVSKYSSAHPTTHTVQTQATPPRWIQVLKDSKEAAQCYLENALSAFLAMHLTFTSVLANKLLKPSFR